MTEPEIKQPGGIRRPGRVGLGSSLLLIVLIGGCSGQLNYSLLVPPPQEGEAPKANGTAPPDKPAPGEEGVAKPTPEKHGPPTVFEALHKYWRCLHGCPDARPKADKKEEDAKGANGEKKSSGNGNGKKEEGEKNPPAEKTSAGENGSGPGKEGRSKNPPGEKEPGDKENNGKEKEKEPDKDKDKENQKEAEPEWYSAHAQATVVTQKHNEFPSPYIGPNSLLPVEPQATSATATLYLDTRLWEGGELVFNPEVAGGRGFSNTSGIAGFPNGEITRVGSIEPMPYIARLFLRQTFGFGGEQEKIEDEANQIAGKQDINRLTFAVGKFSATDLIDNNRYSHDPRTQFLPWSIMYNGAWDYPANVRGYTYGIGIDYNTKCWALRYGIFAEPAFANGAPLDPHFLKANGQAVELEGRYKLNEHPGKVRLMAYLNRAHMGDYLEALAAMPVNPDVTLTRAYRFKYGFGLNWEQEITKDLGVFGRLGWDDGHTESWAFTAIDRLAEIGWLLNGRCWCRPNDQVGFAFAAEGLAKDHRDYLAAGGLDFIIGDGRLNYGLEKILETFYNLQIRKGIIFTVDFQYVDNPAYNRDRGPVVIGSGRLHLEF